MKNIKRLILTICTLAILMNCSKDDVNSGNTFEKLATILNVTSDAAKIFQDTFYTFNDTLRALHAVGNFLDDHEAVESAFYISSELIDIKFTNGLSGSIYLIEVNENGEHLTRGGKSSGVLTKFSSSGSTTSIKNAKVLVLNPYLDEFNYPGGDYNSYLPFFEGGSVVLEVTHIDNKNVRLSDINSMDEYGLVILNTHGLPNCFSMFNVATKSEPWNEEWTSALVQDMILQSENLPPSLFENGELELGTTFLVKNNTTSVDLSISIKVTDDYIRNSNLDLEDVIIFGNHCYSGITHPFTAGDNMVEAWQSKNVATYYGYAFDNLISSTVQNDFCRTVEASLIKRLAQDNDTTGIAHLSSANMPQSYDKLVYSNILGIDVSTYKEYARFRRAVNREGGEIPLPFYFKKFFSGNYLWGCTDSLLDDRDMQVYRTVCIGDQIWMAENLNWDGAGVCFDFLQSNCDNFGRLYSWYEVMNGSPASSSNPSGVQGICPEGWHVPSEAEWYELIYFAGGTAVAGSKLKSTSSLWDSPNTGAIDEFGFSGLGAGLGFPGGFYGGTQGTQGTYLTTTNYFTPNGSQGNYIFWLWYNEIRSDRGVSSTEDKRSCRCVKD